MRKLFLLTIVVVAIAVPVTTASGTHRDPKTFTIKVGDDFFSPTKKTIHKRDVVKWVWVGPDGKPGTTANEHTVTESKGRFTSEEKFSGTYKRRFKKAGTFRILCAVHEDMTMKVVVR